MADKFTYKYELYMISIWMIKTIIIEFEKEQADFNRDIEF